MVKSVIDDVTTYYVGGIYELEVDGGVETERKYYSVGSKRIATPALAAAASVRTKEVYFAVVRY